MLHRLVTATNDGSRSAKSICLARKPVISRAKSAREATIQTS